jgi:hypothetical protein
MMLVDVYQLPVTVSLAVVGTLIGASIGVSLLVTPKPLDAGGVGPAGNSSGDDERQRAERGTTGRLDGHRRIAG